MTTDSATRHDARKGRHRPTRSRLDAGRGRIAMLVTLGLLLLSCDRSSPPPPPPVPLTPTDTAEPVFVDCALELNIDFTHTSGFDGRYHPAEIMGPGAALLDYDGDGDLDVYLVQGGRIDADPTTVEHDRLYRNDLDGEAHTLRFTDVTAASAIDARGYGMSVATGDYDNDGDIDLYLGNFGSNQLWRNRGDGTFQLATADAGVDDPRWTVPTLFFDFDGDGWLDLYVGNYLEVTSATERTCRASTGAPDYCAPSVYEGVTDRLFRNRGDGSFEDVSSSTGIGRVRGKSLGAVAFDADRDGRPDLFVANDGEPNTLWMNRDGRFRDEAIDRGVAVNGDGAAEASMGIAAADFDDDGDIDLLLTHLTTETNTLYVNDGAGRFSDGTIASGLGLASLMMTGFGVAVLDYDLDGTLDLAIANGAVRALPELARAGDKRPFGQRNQLFRGLGSGRFEDLSATAGEPFRRRRIGRGIAAGDVDRDGRPDLVIANVDGPAAVLVNTGKEGHHWLGVSVIDRTGRDAIGALARLDRHALPSLHRRCDPAGSYASSSDLRILFGLGTEAAIDRLVVTWPDGDSEAFVSLSADRYVTLRQGTGTPTP